MKRLLLLSILVGACGTDESSDTSAVAFTIGGTYSMWIDESTLVCNNGFTDTITASVEDVTISASDDGSIVLIDENSYRYTGRLRADNTFLMSLNTVLEDGVNYSGTIEGTFTPNGWAGDVTSSFYSDGLSCDYAVAFNGERL